MAGGTRVAFRDMFTRVGQNFGFAFQNYNLYRYPLRDELAVDCVYWLNINKDIERVCRSCPACQELQEPNRQEPLIAHEIPSHPWQSIASDLFEIDHHYYLLVTDRYSKFPVVEEMRAPVTSKAVADHLAFYCGLFVVPMKS